MINKAGDVVLVRYSNMNGTAASGIFLIVYDEAVDNGTQHGNNICALKITTSTSSISSYYTQLDLGKDTFFDKQCWVVCNKLNIFNKTQITKKLGRIDKVELLKVYNQYKDFSNQIEKQMLSSIMGIR